MSTPIPRNSAPLTARAAAAATGGRVASWSDRDAAAAGATPGGGPGRAARGIVSDSRAVTPGCAFVALRGQRYDGHDYVDAAVRAGAVLVIVERGRAPRGTSADVVEVGDTLRAWGDLAQAHVRAWRAGPADFARGPANLAQAPADFARGPANLAQGSADLAQGLADFARDRGPARASARAPSTLPSARAVFAITGSAGKTTTKEFCAALCARIGATHSTAGNLNNRVGVPAVAFGLAAEHRFGVFEIAMSVRGEIAALAAAIEPDVGIVTNVGLAHAEGVGGTRADVAREKGDLFAALAPDAVAVACFDDEAAMAQIERTRARRVVTFGGGAGADYRLLERAPPEWAGSRMRFARRSGGPASSVCLPIPGEAAALDFLAALAAVEAVGGRLSAGAVDAALAGGIAPPPGRMQARVLRSGTTVLDDTYNANPESVRAALRTLGELARGRRAVVVLGEMCELGPLGVVEHERLGGAVAKCGAQVIVSCGGLADRTAIEAQRAGVRAIRASDVEAAARDVVAIVVPGDVVLVKASRRVEAERVVRALVAAGGGDSAPPVGAI